MPINVLVADNSEIIRKAIARLLEGFPEIQLVAEAVSLSQTVQLIGAMQPHIVLLDIHMDGERGVTPLHLKSSLDGARLLAMSFWSDDGTRALASHFGALALLNKMNLSAELIPAIKLYASDQGAQGAS